MVTINELFSGIGAFRKAFENLGIPHKVVGISEIDKFAIKSYEAIFGATRNYGDISKVDKLDYADLWTYGFPCQDISVAGMQKGIVKGETRSGLLYEVQRLLLVAKQHDELPKYLILENVKNLVGKKFLPHFELWVEWLSELGYNTYWQVINAKDCGIPQNRERVFAVSVRRDIDQGFKFPEPIPLEKSMWEYLDEEVDEKFYLSDTYIEYAEELTLQQIEVGGGFRFEPRERERERRTDDCQDHHDKGGQQGNRKFYPRGVSPLNPHNDGTCRTIKAQYPQTSFANFLRTGTFGATGVVKFVPIETE